MSIPAIIIALGLTLIAAGGKRVQGDSEFDERCSGPVTLPMQWMCLDVVKLEELSEEDFEENGGWLTCIMPVGTRPDRSEGECGRLCIPGHHAAAISAAASDFKQRYGRFNIAFYKKGWCIYARRRGR